jgi:hypothetical protein
MPDSIRPIPSTVTAHRRVIDERDHSANHHRDDARDQSASLPICFFFIVAA